MVLDRYTRRDVLDRGVRLAGGATALGLLAGCGDETSSGGERRSGGRAITSKTVVWADYGGSSLEARKKAYFEPFSKETGVRVTPATADPARFALMAKSGRGQWDLMDTDGFQAIRWIGDDLVEALPTTVTRASLVEPEKFQQFAAGGYSYSYVQGYLRKTFTGAKPETWADFWDTSRFPGKRAWPKYYNSVLEIALMADGVAPDSVYPLDFDRAFAKLDELRPHMLFYESFGEGQQFLQQGSVALAVLANGRFQDLIDKGADAEIVWNQAALLPWTAAAIPKGAPHSDAAFALVDFMTDPVRQAAFAELTHYGPTNPAAFEHMDDATTATLPNSLEHRNIAQIADPVYLAEVDDEYLKRYTEWLAG